MTQQEAFTWISIGVAAVTLLMSVWLVLFVRRLIVERKQLTARHRMCDCNQGREPCRCK